MIKTELYFNVDTDKDKTFDIITTYLSQESSFYSLHNSKAYFMLGWLSKEWMSFYYHHRHHKSVELK